MAATLQQVVARARKGGAVGAARLEPFADQLFRKADDAFLEAFDADALYAMAKDGLAFLDRLGGAPDAVAVDVVNPTFAADGWESERTVVRLALADRPFVVDSRARRVAPPGVRGAPRAPSGLRGRARRRRTHRRARRPAGRALRRRPGRGLRAVVRRPRGRCRAPRSPRRGGREHPARRRARHRRLRRHARARPRGRRRPARAPQAQRAGAAPRQGRGARGVRGLLGVARGRALRVPRLPRVRPGRRGRRPRAGGRVRLGARRPAQGGGERLPDAGARRAPPRRLARPRDRGAGAGGHQDERRGHRAPSGAHGLRRHQEALRRLAGDGRAALPRPADLQGLRRAGGRGADPAPQAAAGARARRRDPRVARLQADRHRLQLAAARRPVLGRRRDRAPRGPHDHGPRARARRARAGAPRSARPRASRSW